GGVKAKEGHGSDESFAVVRYNLDGSLDKTFAGSGQVTTNLSSAPDVARDIVIQPDGKILAAGWGGGGATARDFAVVRYNADGTLDSSFGSKGTVPTDINNKAADAGEAMALQSDGKIVVAGMTGYANDLALVRYNANGSLDTSFGTGGKVITHFSQSVAASVQGGMDMALTPGTGKIVVV